MNPQAAIAALIHDQLGQTLKSVFADGVGEGLFDIRRLDGHESLLHQLLAPGEGPPHVSIAFGLDILGNSISGLVGDLGDLPTPSAGPLAFLKTSALADLKAKVREALGRRVGLLDRDQDAIADMVTAQDPSGLREVADRLFDGVLDVFGGGAETRGAAFGAVSRLRQLLGRDVGIALPFATIFNALQRAGRDAAAIPENVESGLLSYFLTREGFTTVDRERIVAPVHLSDVSEAFVGALEHRDLAGLQLRGLLSKATAERYLRDTVRIVVEAAYDAGRGLTGPGGQVTAVTSELRNRSSEGKPADAIERQFVTWFRGFAAMAESAAMRAVEVGVQGVSQFQTNPLIAAAAGSFAGTVARKLAHDSFLAVLRRELG